jgi:hypothetical protein
MAKFSEAFLRSMTQPSYQEGLFTAAKELGGLRGRLEKERLEEAEKQQRTQAVTSGLEALGSNNVENLKKAAQKFASLNMPEQAAAYMKQAVALEQRLGQDKIASQVARGKEALVRYGTARGMNLKTDSGKEGFFRMSGAYDIPVEDSVSLYNELTNMTGDPNALTAKDIRVSFQDVLNQEGEEVTQAVFTLGDKIIKQEAVGLTKGKADDITDYGLTARSTPADYDMAILKATNEGANEDARNIQERRDKLFPDVISLSDSLALARSVTPQFDELLMYESNAANLDAVADRSDLAGASAIMERIISSNFPNDLKAATELERFRASKSLIRKGFDFVSRTATGELTDATIQDYRDIAEIMRIIGKGNIQDTIDSLYMANESDAADRLFDVYIASDPNAATIVSIQSP